MTRNSKLRLLAAVIALLCAATLLPARTTSRRM